MKKRKALATPDDYKAVFEDSKIGALVLEDLINKFGWIPSRETDGINRVLNQFEFAGSQKVLDSIAIQINIANGVISGGTFDMETGEEVEE